MEKVGGIYHGTISIWKGSRSLIDQLNTEGDFGLALSVRNWKKKPRFVLAD